MEGLVIRESSAFLSLKDLFLVIIVDILNCQLMLKFVIKIIINMNIEVYAGSSDKISFPMTCNFKRNVELFGRQMCKEDFINLIPEGI